MEKTAKIDLDQKRESAKKLKRVIARVDEKLKAANEKLASLADEKKTSKKYLAAVRRVKKVEALREKRRDELKGCQESIDALEEYVDQTAVIMIFVSKGYFKSGNCLREARCTVQKKKPIALMHDNVRGGAALDFLRDDECPTELRGPIFDGRDVIEWHRIKDFQLVSLKQLAEQLLLGCPSYSKQAAVPLYIPGEIMNQRLAFREPVRIYASRNNPGALAAAHSLRDSTVVRSGGAVSLILIARRRHTAWIDSPVVRCKDTRRLHWRCRFGYEAVNRFRLPARPLPRW